MSIRGNSFKLTKNLAVLSQREKNVYTNRIVNSWNSLSDSVVTNNYVAGFKSGIGRE